MLKHSRVKEAQNEKRWDVTTNGIMEERELCCGL